MGTGIISNTVKLYLIKCYCIQYIRIEEDRQEAVSQKSTPKRSYDSTRRKQQASQTRQLIIQAAGDLFLEYGYSGATIEAIAHQAGVSPETIYATFGNKRSLLTRLIEISLVGDEEPISLMERPGPQAVKSEKDQNRQIDLFAQDMGEIMSRMAPIFAIMRTAAKIESDIREMLDTLLENRLAGMRKFIGFLNANGSLKGGLTVDEAAETVWAITSAEIYDLMTIDRGWTPERYQKWLSDTLISILLK